MAPPSPTQLAWRARIEAVLRVAAPALDLLLAAGDRVSRVVDREESESALDAGPATVVPRRRAIAPARGAEARLEPARDDR